jgi:hypothetical protein
VGVTTNETTAVIENVTTETNNTTGTTGNTVTTSGKSTNSTGRVVFTITDNAISLDSLDSIIMTLSKVSVKNSKGNFVTVLTGPKQFNLLDLYRGGRAEIFSDINLEAGTYSQIVISIDKITVTAKGGVNAVESKLPSNELSLNSKIVVEKGKTSAVAFDFVAGKSIHQTGSGAYIFFPVVKVSSQHQVSKVQTLGKNTELFGGLTDFDQTWGMDENGVLQNNFVFNGLSKINFLGDVIRVTPYDEKTSDIQTLGQSIINDAIKNGYIEKALSIKTIMKSGKTTWQISGIKNQKIIKVYADVVTGEITGTE